MSTFIWVKVQLNINYPNSQADVIIIAVVVVAFGAALAKTAALDFVANFGRVFRVFDLS